MATLGEELLHNRAKREARQAIARLAVTLSKEAKGVEITTTAYGGKQ